MHTSETIGEIAGALLTFHTKVGSIKKTAENPFFKSKYADLSSILEAIADPLQEAKLTFVQFPSGQYGLTTLLMHESGEWVRAEYEMKPSKDDPQGRGSALTYQRRYALCSILGLNTEDDDGNEASGNPKEKVIQYEKTDKPEPKGRREVDL